jgi:hypothetical protein
MQVEYVRVLLLLCVALWLVDLRLVSQWTYFSFSFSLAFDIEFPFRLSSSCTSTVLYHTSSVYTVSSCLREPATAPISRSSGCFCSSCRALGTRCCGCIELVNLVIALGNLLGLLGTSWSSSGLDIRCCWLCLHQGDLFLSRKVLYLQRQACK